MSINCPIPCYCTTLFCFCKPFFAHFHEIFFSHSGQKHPPFPKFEQANIPLAPFWAKGDVRLGKFAENFIKPVKPSLSLLFQLAQQPFQFFSGIEQIQSLQHCRSGQIVRQSAKAQQLLPLFSASRSAFVAQVVKLGSFQRLSFFPERSAPCGVFLCF